MLIEIKILMEIVKDALRGTVLLVCLLALIPVAALLIIVNYIQRWRIGARAPKALYLSNFMASVNKKEEKTKKIR